MNSNTNMGLGKQIDLNENPQMPDNSGVKSPMNTSAAGAINIGSFNVNTSTETAAGESLVKALSQAKKDSSNE